MMLLVIDTSTEWPAVGLSDRRGSTWTAESNPARRHGRDLLPAIRDLLAAADRKVSDLEVIGVGVGPGSYTGLRIGITAAKVLAYVSGAALVGMDSLESAAETAPADALRVAVVADAQRGDVYAAELCRQAVGEPLSTTFASRIETLTDWSGRLSVGSVVVGPGLASPKLRAAIPGGVIVTEPFLPPHRPDRLLARVERLWSAGRRDNLWTLEPKYLRRSAAEDQWDARGHA